MRRTVAVLSAAVLLTACASKASPSAGSASPSTSPSGSASASGSPSDAASATTSSAPPTFAPAPAGQAFSVTGAYGTEPTITFPSATPPTELKETVVSRGTGKAVASGDVIVAQYVGQIWAGDLFGDSYKDGSPLVAPIGVKQLLTGWDKTIVGLPTGSRVLLTIPPADGYGTQGSQDGRIKPTDTIVFAIDLVASYKPDTAPPAGAVAVTPAPDTKGVTVTGAPGKEPKVTIPAGTAEPTAITSVVLARGTGKPVTKGFIMLHADSIDWTGKSVGSTWTQGITGQPVGKGSGLDAVVGLPIGSRVLLLIPKDPTANTGHPAIAVVVDIVAQVDVPGLV